VYDSRADNVASINAGAVNRPDCMDDVVKHAVSCVEEHDEEHFAVGFRESLHCLVDVL